MKALQEICLVENFELTPIQQGVYKRYVWSYHLIIEFWNSPFDILAEARKVEAALVYAITNGDNHKEALRKISYQFQPYGVSAQVNNGKAHIYIHTWPENGYSAIDIVADTKERAYNILEKLQEKLLPEKICIAEVIRGLSEPTWGKT